LPDFFIPKNFLSIGAISVGERNNTIFIKMTLSKCFGGGLYQQRFPSRSTPAVTSAAASINARKYPGRIKDSNIPAPKQTADMPKSLRSLI